MLCLPVSVARFLATITGAIFARWAIVAPTRVGPVIATPIIGPGIAPSV
jgi:hypothetical protein